MHTRDVLWWLSGIAAGTTFGLVFGAYVLPVCAS